ncbi:hypothetical protein [Stenotrophomonas sp. NA06056]|uniref:hypothetical protein n=1 Tax=Stenotrophomonas sp. NA06056 TaxID=2742129 RepID=UPI00158D97B2|nr:hypothetical protein [Stenotrophomonas sp. NA06056]QKW57872.1 hypothetical protein HUT07_15160 [Stenotrophomonas sp. NA06056]
MAVNKSVGVILSSAVLIALSGCRADDTATAGGAPDHAQTVERAADVEHVPAQPVDVATAMRPAQATGQGVPADAVEMRRSEDGSTLEIRKRDAGLDGDVAVSEPAQPAQ